MVLSSFLLKMKKMEKNIDMETFLSTCNCPKISSVFCFNCRKLFFAISASDNDWDTMAWVACMDWKEESNKICISDQLHLQLTPIICLACVSISIIVTWYLARLSNMGVGIVIGLGDSWMLEIAGLVEILSHDIFLERVTYQLSLLYVCRHKKSNHNKISPE